MSRVAQPEPAAEPQPEPEPALQSFTAETELRDRFHLASAGLDGRLIRSEWIQLCDELQMLLPEAGQLQTEAELSEQGYAFFDESTRGRDDATLGENDFLRWWGKRSPVIREHVESALLSERLEKTKQLEAAQARETSTIGQTTDALDAVGLASNGLIGREVGAQLTEQIMELRGIRGFEEAEEMGDILWDMSKDMTTAGVSFCAHSRDWITNVLPTVPRRLWAWLKEPVPISEETSMADWWKVFVFHLLSYCFPPLIFWSLTRKVTPGVVLTDTRSYSVEFLYRSFWLAVSATMPVKWYFGELPTLVKSEVWLNICMYTFLAVVNSHEEANLSKVRTSHRTTKTSNELAAADSHGFNKELSAYIEFTELAEEIELHSQATGRFGPTGQRLTELEGLSIQEPRLDSFDEFSFSRDFEKEITEARTGKVFTDFSVRFTELIVMLGRQASWYSAQFESVANPDPADPFCGGKNRQYMSCLIKMKQSEIAKLRLAGKLEEAGRAETALIDLKLLHRDIALCDDLRQKLEQLGNQDRNIILRVLPFMSIGLFLLLYVGNFTQVLESTATTIKHKLSNDGLKMSDVGDMLHEWECALYCYAARVLSFIFLFTSFMMLIKWALKQVMQLLQWTLSRCCTKCDHNWIERQLHRQTAALQRQLDLQLGPKSTSPHEEAKNWDVNRAMTFLGANEPMPGDAAAGKRLTDECRCCQARQRAWSLDPKLPLCGECQTRRRDGVRLALRLTSTETMDEFLSGVQGNGKRDISCFERFCTGKGRQAATLSNARNSSFRAVPSVDEAEAQDGSHEDKSAYDLVQLVDSWRLMLATYRIWCEEVIDAKYRQLSQKLRRDEAIKQWKRKVPRATVPASVLGKVICVLSEFKAEQQFVVQRGIMILGTLACAAAPWIHDKLLGCHDERTCEAPTFNGTSSSNATVWAVCEGLHPPCRDVRGLHIFLNGSLCQVRPPVPGFDQAHACLAEGEEDPYFWWRVVSAFTEFTLTFSIFSLLLRVLRGYHLRSLFMEHFSQTVPWPGIRQTKPNQYAYGLLPRFELNNAGNIVAWNKIRLFLQTFEAEEFHQEQQKIAWVVLISFVMMVCKIVALIQHPAEEHGLRMSVLMDTMMIKVIVMQLNSIVVICNLLWTGVKTTRMQEHGLRHILLLKKSQLTNFRHPLYFSASKRVDILVPADFTLPQLQDCIESKLGISVAQQRIAVHGISFYGNGSGSSVHDRGLYENRRAKLIAKKARREQSHDQGALSEQETAELQWYQSYLRKDDAIQSVDAVLKLRGSLHAKKYRSPEDADRLRWVEEILQPYDTTSSESQTLLTGSDDLAKNTFPRLHTAIEDKNASRQQSITRTSSFQSGVIGGAGVTSAPTSLALKGPSLKALVHAATTPTDRDSRSSTTTPTTVQEFQTTADYLKYKILIREGQEILVTSDTMHPSDKKLLERWLNIHRTEADTAGLNNSKRVLIIGQELHGANALFEQYAHHISTGAVDYQSVSTAKESVYQSVASTTQQELEVTTAELLPIEFEVWAEIDTMRHMIDSLVAIMEEERLPLTHLETIEDTRPTIRLPFYGPYPLTTALFASVTTVMFGAVSTSVTVLVSHVLKE